MIEKTHIAHQPEVDLRATIRAMLSNIPPELPPSLLYNDKGASLFNQICQMSEYYPARLEQEVLQQHRLEISKIIGSAATVMEYGSGDGKKGAALLEVLDRPSAYLPVDVSLSELEVSAQRMAKQFPGLLIQPIRADFTQPFDSPVFALGLGCKLIHFSGSNIGNFHRAQAIELLKIMSQQVNQLGGEGRLLIAVDTEKNEKILNAAYNDAAGYSEAFILNGLQRLQTEFDTHFRQDLFEYQAAYWPQQHRVEMRLVTREKQILRSDDLELVLDRGKYIVAEYSYKYSPARFRALAKEAGLNCLATWTDDKGYFSLHLLEPTN